MSTFDKEIKYIPSLSQLSNESIRTIHDASIKILKKVGVRVENEEARNLLEKKGGEVEGNIVKLPPSLVMDSVEKAPHSFVLHGRKPENDVKINENNLVRAPGYGPINIRTVKGRRESTLSDYEKLVKLVQMESVLDCVGYQLCNPRDVSKKTKHLEMMKKNLFYSSKPVMGAANGSEKATDCINLAKLSVSKRKIRGPYIATLVNTISPLALGREMTEGLLTYAKEGQAIIVSGGPMCGASGPSTLAGSIIQANAEIISGITIAQLENPGTPVIYGLGSSNIDMRYGTATIGAPESALFASFAPQISQYYGIPSRGGGALTDSKLVDYQGGFESMLLLLITSLSGINFMIHSCGILESYSTVSPEKLILDCEMIKYVDRFLQGFDINKETFAFDNIFRVGPSGNFLGEEHTREHILKEFVHPDIADKKSYSGWKKEGRKDAFKKGGEKVEELLGKYDKPQLDSNIKKDIEEYIEKKGK